MHSFSQNDYKYVGGIKLNDSTVISYKINFQVNKGNVKGFSITDLGGIYETRSTILGEYDEINKALSFREVTVVYTKTPLEEDYGFCHVNTTIQGFALGKTRKIKTKFIGLFSDHTECVNGEIFLNAVEDVEKRLNKVTDKINKSKKVPDSIKQKLNLYKMMDSLQMNVLKKDQVMSMFSKAKTIKFTIYDGGKEDGDRISIFSNGKQILSNFEANKVKKVFAVEMIDDKTEIVIKALNEGLIAPNTVIVEIEDDNNTIKALSNLNTGETTQIDILRQK
ncbi:hypothetical protein [Aestuariivivens insulae]|uniref:hypothetical protein n=1 Tax=Aestuariivivens insulae TaxID=1621988 RepID=UPI001F568DEE|nr:hypothetical protein [Aestuariivivens insulae]